MIVFVTSTGFVAPGIDTKLIASLGLKRNIARVPVNFMGCAAAMTGLRVCSDHVRANPHSKALMICLELSSVNAVFKDDLNDIIIHSIFRIVCINTSTSTISTTTTCFRIRIDIIMPYPWEGYSSTLDSNPTFTFCR